MKATVNGIEVEGTAKEVHEYVEMNKRDEQVKVEMGKKDWSEARHWWVLHEKLDESAGPEVGIDRGIKFDYGKLGN